MFCSLKWIVYLVLKKNVLLSLPPSPRWFVWGRVPSGGLPSKKRAQNKNIGDWRGAQKITFPHTSKQLAKFYGQISAKRRGRFFGDFEGHPGLPDPWPRGGRSDPSGAPLDPSGQVGPLWRVWAGGWADRARWAPSVAPRAVWPYFCATAGVSFVIFFGGFHQSFLGVFVHLPVSRHKILRK